MLKDRTQLGQHVAYKNANNKKPRCR